MVPAQVLISIPLGRSPISQLQAVRVALLPSAPVPRLSLPRAPSRLSPARPAASPLRSRIPRPPPSLPPTADSSAPAPSAASASAAAALASPLVLALASGAARGAAAGPSEGHDGDASASAMAAAAALPPPPAPVAVVGAGVAGSLVAALLARQGIPVAVFDMGRGPGGRMAQRRVEWGAGIDGGAPLQEGAAAQGAVPAPTLPAGLQLRFDHGAPFFRLHSPALRRLLLEELALAPHVLREWAGARLAQWDAVAQRAVPGGAARGATCADEGGEQSPPLVAVPGSNALCQRLLQSSPLIRPHFGAQVLRAECHTEQPSGSGGGPQPPPVRWRLRLSSGAEHGPFAGLVLAAAYRTVPVELHAVGSAASPPSLAALQRARAAVSARPCFALLLAFARPLQEVPFDAVSVANSAVLAALCRDSSKPGRAGAGLDWDKAGSAASGSSAPPQSAPECWVAHSSTAYAAALLEGQPPGRPSEELLRRVAADMQAEVARVLRGMREAGPAEGGARHPEGWAGRGLGADGAQAACDQANPSDRAEVPFPPPPLFTQVHRWGGAFPVCPLPPDSLPFLASEECLVAACGDFCAAGSAAGTVEGAVGSAAQAAEKMAAMLLQSPMGHRL